VFNKCLNKDELCKAMRMACFTILGKVNIIEALIQIRLICVRPQIQETYNFNTGYLWLQTLHEKSHLMT